MKTHRQLVFLLSAAFFFGMAAGGEFIPQKSFAQSKGYEGLIPPDDSAAEKNAEPPGYSGLIEGPVPQEQKDRTEKVERKSALPLSKRAAAPEKKPEESSVPQVTYAPGYEPPKVRTVEDIKAVAARREPFLL